MTRTNLGFHDWQRNLENTKDSMDSARQAAFGFYKFEPFAMLGLCNAGSLLRSLVIKGAAVNHRTLSPTV